jgi:hypothetical protein
VQGAHQRLVDSALGEVEAGQIPVSREACNLHLIVNRPDFALGDFGLDQVLQDTDGLLIRRRPLAGQRLDRAGHAEQLECL